MLAYDYPILGVFWTLFMWFIWIAWFVLLFRVIADIFRSGDLGGWGKALWLILVILVPFLGVFVYVIARGHGMTDRDVQRAQASEAAFRSYVQDTAGTAGGGTADELTKLAQLRDSGVITAEEFDQQKAKLLT
ncbi:SHOCT domain-containing protein [Ilumatobacter nonamiensis]|uniref:SHOCT domain-containing protein n=1 Tax=Ilumatobacter nonamiensis TaxID=467093 RepID=UPI00058C0170|nr:SHOCT domain-containing protein [Ilumatobacter nonamiensis]